MSTLPGRDFELLPVDEVSLYVHIPFCTSRCRYCSFVFETGWSPRVMQAVLDAILRQATDFRQRLFPGTKPRIRTIYFGGGTPSVIPSALLDQFLTTFRHIWDLPATSSPPGMYSPVPEDGERQSAKADGPDGGVGEWAFEVNPESLSPELLSVLSRHGINRLSMGVQTLDDEILAQLGRQARRADVERAVRLLADARDNGAWNGKVNMDLITGIPGQTPESVGKDAAFLVNNGADHVSVYALTVEPGTVLEQYYRLGLGVPLNKDAHEDLWASADAILEKAGLKNYEVSNYARPGSESLHNLGYWSMLPYVGMGPGAVGTLPGTLAQSQARVALRLTGSKTFEFARPGLRIPTLDLEVLSARDFFVDHLLTGLRTTSGLSRSHMSRVFGPAGDKALEVLEQYWHSRGYIEETTFATAGKQKTMVKDRLALTRDGRLVLDPLLADSLVLLDRLGKAWARALTCTWP